jgi:glycosyltransferase involved in cell wall biosynthesis
MQFVTITDHNRIDGCLEIADLPGVFISEQISTYFPENRCRVELLAWNITEAQHRDFKALRENIYDLQRYLSENQILHSVAHPLYVLDEKLTAAHFEKLILLFRHFEGLNGLRDSVLSEVTQFLLNRLTPKALEEMANRHGLEPTHPEPWKKVLTAGSDDHGGLFAGATYTETKTCKTVAEFLAKVRAGENEIRGKVGTPLALSHGLYNTGYRFINDKFMKGGQSRASLLPMVFHRFMEGRDPTEFTFADKLGMLAEGIVSGEIFELAKPAHASLWKQLSPTFEDTGLKRILAEQTHNVDEPERRAFLIANLFVSKLAFRFFTQFVSQVSSGNLFEALQDISVLAPLLLTVSPYVYSFRAQAPARPLLRDISQRVTGEVPPVLKNRKRAWFTDTLEDVNGVATTIRKMTAAGVAAGEQLIVVTCRESVSVTGIPIKNFTPIGEFELPEYELQKLSFPPILEMLDYIQRENFTELIISTPGPVGIVALMAGKLLGIRTVGIYHTDFPQYVRILTDDNFLETLTWTFMHWFYSQQDLVFVNSGHYKNCWVDRGIAPEKLAILPRGLDTELFNPTRRNPDFWNRFGGTKGKTVLLYVGRISKEKDLDVIAAAYRRLLKAKAPVQMAFVGEGPYLKELQAQLPEAWFTGALSGVELATAYASGDIFLFPSTTDTYGNVVVEAHASGLPTVVSDTGGPKELVTEGVNGYITRSLDTDDFLHAIERLLAAPDLRQTMATAAYQGVQNRAWSGAFQRFWALSPE